MLDKPDRSVDKQAITGAGSRRETAIGEPSLRYAALIFTVLAIAYAGTARVGLTLILPPENVASLWPASGLAAGVLIAVGPRFRWPVALAVMVATAVAVASTMSASKHQPGALVVGLCNALETLSVSWLFGRLDRAGAGFNRLDGVIAFLLAAIGGTVLAAVPAALVVYGLGMSDAELVDLGLIWVRAHAAGLITIAPLIVILPTTWRDPQSTERMVEGLVGVVLVGLAASYAFGLGPEGGPLNAAVPALLLFPLLLWLAVRLPPVYSAAAVCVTALVLTSLVMHRTGQFGAASIPFTIRVLAAQLAMVTTAVCGLSLSAILTQLRGEALERKASDERLRKGLDAGNAYVFDIDALSRSGHRYGELASQLGLDPFGRMGEFASRLAPQDAARYQELLQSLTPSSPTFNSRFRIHDKYGKDRVVAHRAEANFTADGRLSRLLGTVVDVTGQAAIEQQLRDSEQRLRQGLDAGDVYVFDIDAIGRRGVRFGALASQLGLELDGSLGEFSKRLHPDDNARYQQLVRAMTPGSPGFNGRFRVRDTNGNERILAHRAEGTFLADGTLCRMQGTGVDITRQARIEQELRDSQELLRQCLDAGDVYVFEFNMKTRKGRRIGALAEKLGLAADGHLDDYYERLVPEEADSFRAVMTSIAEGKAYSGRRFHLRASDGLLRVVAHRAEGQFENGTLVRIIGTCADVTGQAHIEQALRDSEERLRRSLNAGAVYAFDFDFASNRVYRFGGLIDRLGLPAEGAIEDYGGQLHPDDRERFEDHLRSLSPATPQFDDRLRLRTTDGSYLHIVHRAEASFDAAGKMTRIVGTCADVTDREQAERALRDSESRLKTALRIGQVFAFDWNPATDAVRRSDNAAAILGLTADRGPMGRQEFLTHIPEPDRSQSARDIAALSPSSPVNETRFRFVRPDGQLVWLEVVQGGTFDAAGRLRMVSGLTRDVTQAKLAEERQHRLIEELNHRVKNTLAQVGVVIARSREGQTSLDEYSRALLGRISSMVRTHKRLSDSKWDGVNLAALVADELEPYRTASNTIISGPDIILAANAAQAISLTVHELATNAAKHGALNTAGGRVDVHWSLDEQPSSEHTAEKTLRIEWIETMERSIALPQTEGFGLNTIRGLTSFELEADVRLEFAERGVRCTIVVPADLIFHRAPDPMSDGPLALKPSQ